MWATDVFKLEEPEDYQLALDELAAEALGLVLVSYGAGCMLGSVLGGRWSDQALRRLTSANDGHYLPEVY